MSVIKDFFIREIIYQGFKGYKGFFSQLDEKSYKILQIPDLLYEFYQGSKGFEGFLSNLNPFQSFKSLTIIYITP